LNFPDIDHAARLLLLWRLLLLLLLCWRLPWLSGARVVEFKGATGACSCCAPLA
jgi:hypothetical protein